MSWTVGRNIPRLNALAKSALLLLLLPFSALVAADCIRLRNLQVEDEGLISRSQLETWQADHVGQCVDRKLIAAILQSINNDLLQRGYVTSRAFIKPQDVRDGALVISIFPGRIARIVEKPQMETTPLIVTAFSRQQGQVLNLRDLETALETIERLPSVSAEFDIVPSQEQGYSEVVVKVRETRKWRLQLGFSFNDDENEPKATISYQQDNPFRVNDQLRVRYNDDALRSSTQGNEGWELGYEFPLGNYLLDVAVGDLSYKRWVSGLNDRYLSEGDTRTLSLAVSRTVFRDQDDRATLGLSLAHKNTETFFAGERIDVSSFKTTVADLSLSHTRLASWGSLVSTIHLYQGLDWFGARDDDYFGQESGLEDDAVLQFTKWTINEQLNMPFAHSRWAWRSQLHAQYADDLLYSSEQISVGSLYTVRGYQVPLSGSRGYFFRNDLVRSFTEERTDPFDAEPSSKRLSWHVGLDYGEVACRGGQNESCGIVSGLGLGFDLSSTHFQMALRWGYPLKKTQYDAADDSRFDVFVTWMF